MHVHLQLDPAGNDQLLRLFLATGVTTVLNLHGGPNHLELREEIENGRLAPLLFTSGRFVNEPAFRTRQQVEDEVRLQAAAGYDFVKMHGELQRDVYHHLMESARRVGIKVIGHAPRRLGIDAVFEARMDAIAHAEEYLYAYFFYGWGSYGGPYNDAAKYEQLVELEPRFKKVARSTAEAGTWVIPNLSIYRLIGLQARDIDTVLERPEVAFVPRRIFATSWVPGNNTYVRRFANRPAIWNLDMRFMVLERLVSAFRDAGVRMLAGTDAPVPSAVPGFSLHDEIEHLAAAGLSPYQALQTATVNPAEFLGVADEAGTVEAGKRADLLLIDGNPLDRIGNTRAIEGVMVRGRWLPRAELDAMLEALRR